jgi:hypothetical protein
MLRIDLRICLEIDLRRMLRIDLLSEENEIL